MMTLARVAEAATDAYFMTFGWIGAALSWEGRNLPLPGPDATGGDFVGSAGFAMLVGYAVFFALAVCWVLLGGDHGP